MFALARLLVMGFIILTIIYICLSLYSRATRRSKLRDEWHAGPQDVDLDSFVEDGLHLNTRGYELWTSGLTPFIAPYCGD